MKTKNVQVIKTEKNSKELFKKWNTQKQTNVKCSIPECFTNSRDNAYIVKELINSSKFITPLCIECYEKEINYSNQSNSTFKDHGLFITIDENLLMEEDEEKVISTIK